MAGASAPAPAQMRNWAMREWARNMAGGDAIDVNSHSLGRTASTVGNLHEDSP